MYSVNRKENEYTCKLRRRMVIFTWHCVGENAVWLCSTVMVKNGETQTVVKCLLYPLHLFCPWLYVPAFFLPHVLDTILYYAWGAHSIGSMDVSGPFAFFPRPPDEQPHRPPLLRASSNTTLRPLFWKCRRRRRSGVLSFLVVYSLNEDFWRQVLTFPLASST